jgi:hypothetical protein
MPVCVDSERGAVLACSGGMTCSRHVLAVLVLMAAACGGCVDNDSSGGGPAAGGTGGSVNAGGANGVNAGGSTGIAGAVGLDGTCDVVSTTPVAWTDTTPLGTPETLLSQVEGTCQAPFSWNASGWSADLTVTPATGHSTISVSVELDRSTIRWVERKASSAMGSCASSLEADVAVALTVPGGTVAGPQKVTLNVLAPSPSVQFSLNQAAFGNWVSIQTADSGITPRLVFDMMPVATACMGRVGLFADKKTDATSGILMMQGAFATWSESGCAMSQTPAVLDDPDSGVSLSTAVRDTFGAVDFPATWGDGSPTTLRLATTISGIQACAETLTNTVIIPVDVVFSTADNRVAWPASPGTVRATIADSRLSHLQLGVSADSLCGSTTDILPYRSADCANVAKVMAQLGCDRYFDSPQPSADGRLELYVYDRNSSLPPSAANRVDRLSFGP